MKEKIVLYCSVLIALAAAAFLFLKWNPEKLIRGTEKPITMAKIEQNKGKSFTGLPAGGDIPRLAGAGDFEDILYEVDYATAEPVSVTPTGVYSLKPWTSPYVSRKKKRQSGKRKPEVIQSKVDIHEDYNQYYLLELPDHSYILAQIPPSEAAAIQKGDHVVLPVGEKVGISDKARGYLGALCEEKEVSMDGVLYTFNDEWYKENEFTLFIIRAGSAVVLFLVLAVGLVLIGNKVFRVKTEE